MPPSAPPTLAATLALVALVAGCGERESKFASDPLLHATSGLSVLQAASVETVLEAWFGTPDEPRLPAVLPKLAELVDLDALKQAAGPVISHTPGVTQGLYRRHCARCHGVTGDGRGPTARYQSPYPRDFRRGVFKWKSTYRAAPPTPSDLDLVIEHGVVGTAMPSFALLPREERNILRQYVTYLAIRGQVERTLVDYVANDLPSEALLAIGDTIASEGFTEVLLPMQLVTPIVDAWIDAETNVVTPPIVATSNDPTEVTAGRELYHSERAGCYKCHGPEGRGGAVSGVDYVLDYDVWNRERVSAQSSHPALVASDLPIRPSRPRRLIGSTPHGGSSRENLFRRLHQGVAGTPMPAVGGVGPGEPGSLTDEEVSQLVDYTLWLRQPKTPASTEVASR